MQASRRQWAMPQSSLLRGHASPLRKKSEPSRMELGTIATLHADTIQKKSSQVKREYMSGNSTETHAIQLLTFARPSQPILTLMHGCEVALPWDRSAFWGCGGNLADLQSINKRRVNKSWKIYWKASPISSLDDDHWSCRAPWCTSHENISPIPPRFVSSPALHPCFGALQIILKLVIEPVILREDDRPSELGISGAWI